MHGDCRCSQCHSHADLHVLQVSFSDAQIGMRSTFLLCRKGLPIDKMQGADNPALEAKIKEHYEAVGWDGETQSGVKVCSFSSW